MSYADDRKANNQLLQQLKSEFELRRPTLQDLGDFIAPWAHDFKFQSSAEDQRPDAQIVNETPCEALEVAVSGVFDGTCNPTEQWFELESSDPDANESHAGQKWLQDTSRKIRGQIEKSNFYRIAPEVFRAMLAFGTGSVLVKEDFEESCVRFYPSTMGSYYIGRDARGNVAYYARELRKTAAQMLQEWGRDNLSSAVAKALDSNQSQAVFDVVHVIKLNPDAKAKPLFAKDRKFVECYYEPGCNEDKELQRGGYDYFPVPTAPWIQIGNRPWGVGPGHFALAASKTLQAREIDVALAGEKQINPPMVAPSGMDLSSLSLLPGAINQPSDPAGGQGLRPLHENTFDLSAGYEGIARVEERIRTAFWNHIFLMISSDNGAKMTAREVVERAREKKLALTPILSVTDSLLKPIISIVYAIAGKRGLLAPFPPELQGKDLKVVFNSSLAKAAQMEKSALTADHVLGFLLPLSQSVPSVMDNYDWDTVVRETGADSGVPASQYRDPKDVEDDRKAQAAAQQQERQSALAEQQSQTAKNLAGADTSGQNALTDLAALAQQQ